MFKYNYKYRYKHWRFKYNYKYLFKYNYKYKYKYRRFKHNYKYRRFKYNYKYKYKYWLFKYKYKYKYKYRTFKYYKYKYKYLKSVLKYSSSTSTNTKYIKYILWSALNSIITKMPNYKQRMWEQVKKLQTCISYAFWIQQKVLLAKNTWLQVQVPVLKIGTWVQLKYNYKYQVQVWRKNRQQLCDLRLTTVSHDSVIPTGSTVSHEMGISSIIQQPTAQTILNNQYDVNKVTLCFWLTKETARESSSSKHGSQSVSRQYMLATDVCLSRHVVSAALSFSYSTLGFKHVGSMYHNVGSMYVSQPVLWHLCHSF